MKKEPAPPANITAQLKAMKINQSIVFGACPAHSVRAIASRMSDRKFATRMENGAVRVWRLK